MCGVCVYFVPSDGGWDDTMTHNVPSVFYKCRWYTLGWFYEAMSFESGRRCELYVAKGEASAG